MGQHHGVTAGLSTGNDGDFMHRICILQKGGHNGMARFMVSREFSFFIAHPVALSFRTVGNFFRCLFQICHGNGFSVIPGCQKGCFIQHIGQVGAGKSRYFLGNGRQVHIRFQRFVSCMDTENGDTASEVRTAYYYAAVKTTGAQEGRVQDIRTVGSCQSNDAFIGTETVHFYQELVQCLFPFIMSAAQSASALTAYGIDFIDKYDAGRIFLCLGEEITHAGRTDTYEHFYKIGA